MIVAANEQNSWKLADMKLNKFTETFFISNQLIWCFLCRFSSHFLACIVAHSMQHTCAHSFDMQSHRCIKHYQTNYVKQTQSHCIAPNSLMQFELWLPS